MRFPWVSRAAYDQLKVERDQAVRADNASWWSLREEMKAERGRYDDLLAKYHELKVSGASVPEPSPTLQRPEFDPILSAITAKAGPDRKLRSMMTREAMKARDLGYTDLEIIQQIEQGVTIDDEAIVL